MTYMFILKCALTLKLPKTTIVAPPSNASKWQMGFNSAFKGLKLVLKNILYYDARSEKHQILFIYLWFTSRRYQFGLHYTYWSGD